MDAGPSAPHHASSADSSGTETSSTAESALNEKGQRVVCLWRTGWLIDFMITQLTVQFAVDAATCTRQHMPKLKCVLLIATSVGWEHVENTCAPIQLDVWASQHRVMYVQSLMAEGCFLFNLLAGECFSVLTLNLSLTHVHVPAGFVTSQLIKKPVVVQYASYTGVTQTRHLQCTYTEHWLLKLMILEYSFILFSMRET